MSPYFVGKVFKHNILLRSKRAESPEFEYLACHSVFRAEFDSKKFRRYERNTVATAAMKY